MSKKPIKKVVIIGAGFAGLRAMSELSEYSYKLEITVVDKRDYSILKPDLPDVALLEKDPEEVQFFTPPALREHNAAWEYASVTRIDPAAQRVYLDNDTALSYDYLIIASGVEYDYGAVEGYALNGYSVCDKEEAIRLSQALIPFEAGDIVIATVASRFEDEEGKIYHESPCEGAAVETALMLDDRLRHLGFRDDTTITLISPQEKLMPEVGEHVRSLINTKLKEKQINHLGCKITANIEEGMLYFKDGTAVASDIAIIIPPFKAPAFIRNSGLGDSLGWLHTDEQMRLKSHANIFAIGNINAMSKPKLGHIAFKQAQTAASVILKEEGLSEKINEYTPDMLCILTVGANDAILVYSDVTYGGNHDIAWESFAAKKLKIVYDKSYRYALGELPAEIGAKLEKLLKQYSLPSN